MEKVEIVNRTKQDETQQYEISSLSNHLWEASDIGTSEVGMAIMASTLTTVVVFVPVLFVPGMSGELIRDMVLTVSFS